MEKKTNDAIYISDILHAIYLSRIPIIVITAVGLLTGIAMSIVSYVLAEMNSNYSITTSIAVTSVTEDGLFTTRSETPNSTDIYLAQEMVDSVIYVLKGDTTLNAALSQLQLAGVTTGDIRNNLSMSQYKQTQIVEITLKWPVAEEGIRILEAINRVAPQILVESLKIGGVSIVNAPKSVSHSASSVKIILWFLMGAVGFFLGIGFAVAKALFFPNVYNARSVSDNLGLQVISEIPYSKSYFSRKDLLSTANESAEDESVRESFLTLAHILRHRMENEKPARLYFTSALTNEGKTSVLANLAVQLAAIECRVLMIDLDVSNPSLSAMFLDKSEYYYSLNAVYRRETAIENAIVHVQASLDLLPLYLENPPLVLNDEVLDIVQQVSESYDFVLMDSPSVGLSANAMNLNRIARAAVFVVRQDTTSLSKAEAALTRLNKSGIQIAGAVLNGAKKVSIVK